MTPMGKNFVALTDHILEKGQHLLREKRDYFFHFQGAYLFFHATLILQALAGAIMHFYVRAYRLDVI